ncbi:hypothetical protein [Sphingomonas sp.]|uniref:hypothetical protein n=1 Tax=Sphingomonas sp. TaxID=28214 RepID=UPI003D6C7BA0
MKQTITAPQSVPPGHFPIAPQHPEKFPFRSNKIPAGFPVNSRNTRKNAYSRRNSRSYGKITAMVLRQSLVVKPPIQFRRSRRDRQCELR